MIFYYFCILKWTPMKVLNATINLKLRKTRSNADGTYPIVLFISFHGRKEIYTGYSCKLSEWDEKSSRVKPKLKYGTIVNKAISELYSRAISIRDEYIINGIQYDSEMIAAKLKSSETESSNNRMSFREISVKMCEERSLRESTRRSYHLMSNRFEKMGIEIISQFDKTKFNQLLKSISGLAEKTRLTYLVNIKAVLDYAKATGIIGHHPMEDYIPSRRIKVTNRHRSLSLKQMNYIRRTLYHLFGLTYSEPYRPPKNINEVVNFSYGDSSSQVDFSDFRLNMTEKRALCVFYLAYLMGGVAFVDMMNLKMSDFKNNNGLLTYNAKRSKTGIPFTIILETNDLLVRAILKYLTTLRKGDQFVPIRVPKGKRAYSNTRHYLNCALRRSWPKINKVFEDVDGFEPIPEDTTYYTLRHTYASVMIDNNCDIALLAESMGRSVDGIGVYVKSLKEDKEVAIAKRVLY